jgi:GPH family glycoside/pentoside/hexuronide:cation symporter
MMGGMLIAAILAKPLANKFGKAEISAASSIIAAAVCILLFAIRPDNVWIYVIINGAIWIGLGIFAMVSWAIITDVIDDSELRVGRREDGTIYAMYSFARKLGQAASAGITGILLSAIGYNDKTAFDGTVLKGIYDISTLVPALGFTLLGLILQFWYPLHKSRVEENVRLLRIKHEGKSE